MNRAYYSDSIGGFPARSIDEIIGRLVEGSRSTGASLETAQIDAWREQILILKPVLQGYRGAGAVYFEFSVPRLGGRIDVLAPIGAVLFVLEFKVGERAFASSAKDQVYDYALDLKNFHDTSHNLPIAPVLIATGARRAEIRIEWTHHRDGVLRPICSTADSLAEVISGVLAQVEGPPIDVRAWEQGRYHPTPTIVEAATALYHQHSVAEITRSDAGARNLTDTAQAIEEIIHTARRDRVKSICFVTGVPGSGKTLVGLNTATRHIDRNEELYSVFLSGNQPLVATLCEALARDKVARERRAGRRIAKRAALSEVKMFI